MTNSKAIGTKLGSMSGKMLTDDDYNQMVHMGTIPQIARYLKRNTDYRHVLEEIIEDDIHREQLELILSKAVIADYKKILHYLGLEAKKYFRYFTRRLEVELIKTLLRRMNSETNFDFLTFQPPIELSFDYQKVWAASNITQFVEALKGSEYYPVLESFVYHSEYLKEFDIEMALDMHYFKHLWKGVRKSRDSSKHELEKIWGYETDITNILWIYRCKRYYNMPGEIIYSFLINQSYHLKKEDIINMVEASDAETMLAYVVKSTKYATIFADSGYRFYEQSYMKFMDSFYRHILKRNRYSVAGIVAYVRLKEYEVYDIVSIVEGIRYGLDISKIDEYLIRRHVT